jgi:hypothetical protein
VKCSYEAILTCHGLERNIGAPRVRALVSLAQALYSLVVAEIDPWHGGASRDVLSRPPCAAKSEHYVRIHRRRFGAMAKTA